MIAPQSTCKSIKHQVSILPHWFIPSLLPLYLVGTSNSNNSKCFNCSGEHFTKECKKPKLQCSECKFLGGGHKKDCSHRGKGGHQAHSAKTEEGATSWDEAKSTENKKKDKGKGCDWSKSIQGMSLNEARAWFKDYENLAAKLEKA